VRARAIRKLAVVVTGAALVVSLPVASSFANKAGSPNVRAGACSTKSKSKGPSTKSKGKGPSTKAKGKGLSRSAPNTRGKKCGFAH